MLSGGPNSSNDNRRKEPPKYSATGRECYLAMRDSCENLRMAVVLGIDGGGTKTKCAIARDGIVLGSATTGASNLVRVAEKDVRAALHGAIRSACEVTGIAPDQIEAACVGIGGASRENVATRIQAMIAEILKCPVEVIGDMQVAYDAAMHGGPGVIVIAGTGSIAYGCNEQGDTARAGGWGAIISDEGSGTWIGKNAVSAVFRAFDSGRSTGMTRHIMDTWKVFTRDDLIVKANTNPQPNFSELAPAVFQSAVEGDTMSQELLADAGVELAKLAKVVIRRLWPNGGAVQVAGVGGIFMNSVIVYKAFENSLRAERPNAMVRVLTEDPVDGALFRAERLISDPGAAGEHP
jgi:glucosamine kinase